MEPKTIELNETITSLKHDTLLFRITQALVILLFLLIIIGSAVFNKNLLFEIDYEKRLLLVGTLLLVAWMSSRTRKETFPVRIEYYEDRVEIIRPIKKRHGKVICEHCVINYPELIGIQYDDKNKTLSFQGDCHTTIWKYHGEDVDETPSRTTFCENARCSIRVNGMPLEELERVIEEINTNSPLPVKIAGEE